MKIGIVTIYNSQNCGSFLQSFALLNFVKEHGYDTAIAKNNMYYKNKMVYRYAMALKYRLLGQNGKADRILKTYKGFKKARRERLNIRKVSENDICIYGSDTIWNFNDGDYFGKEWRHYWGANFGGKKIAYAPSIGPTSVESILKRDELCQCIKKFDSLSVRDANTRAVVRSVLGDSADIVNVVDPTMLMPKSFYEDMTIDCEDSGYILLYYFGIPDKAYMEEISRYAKENGKKLICFGDNIRGVDKQLCFDPIKMMTYYSKADMVITNTFHGNVFSLIFNKPFVNIDAGKAKVNDLLSSFGLSERTISKASDFCEVADRAIDYDKVNLLLEDKRKASGEYLINALKACEGGK